MAEENIIKKSTGFRVDERTMEQIKMLMPVDGSKSVQVFCEKAIEFYMGFLSTDNHEAYRDPSLSSIAREIFSLFGMEMNLLNSRMAIALQELMMAMVYVHEFPSKDLHRMRNHVAKLVENNGGPASLRKSQLELYAMLSEWDGDLFDDGVVVK